MTAGALPGRQLRLGLPLGGRGRSRSRTGPARIDLAWRSLETNAVGLNEFAGWARRSRSRTDARGESGHARGAGGLRPAGVRQPPGRDGAVRPARPARSPASRTTSGSGAWATRWTGRGRSGTRQPTSTGGWRAETARAMRQVDPRIELVACGSSTSGMPTFGAWEAAVLEQRLRRRRLHQSLHAYYEEREGDLASFLASLGRHGQLHRAVIATADPWAPRVRSRKRVDLAFDEWNVWYQHRFAGQRPLELRHDAPAHRGHLLGRRRRRGRRSLLNAFLRHADRVKIACQAQLVNVIGAHAHRAGRAGVAPDDLPPVRADRPPRTRHLPTRRAEGRQHETAAHGEVDTVDAAATWDEATGDVIACFSSTGTRASRRRHGRPARLPRPESPSASASRTTTRAARTRLWSPTPCGRATTPTVRVEGGCLELRLSPASWTAVALTCDP